MRDGFVSAIVFTALLGMPAPGNAQTLLEIRPGHGDIPLDRKVQLTAVAVTIGYNVRTVEGVSFKASCGTVDTSGTLIPTTPGPCTVTARWTTPDGRDLVATASLRVVAYTMARPPSPSPGPPPRRQPPPGPPPATDGMAATLPQFPWPPPEATTRVSIPRGLITKARPPGVDSVVDTLGYVADSIEKALDRARIERAVYAIGDSGFAYVTRVEMIHSGGEPFSPPDRFPNDVATASGRGGFLEFILSRFRARPGYFRIIALVVTSRPISADTAPLRLDAATRLIAGGMATLPPVLRRRAVRDLQSVALIYEFERPSASEEVLPRGAPLVSARMHLAEAGLWTESQLEGR